MNAAEIFKKNSRPLKPIPTDLPVSLKRLPDIKVLMFDVYGTLFVSGSGDVGLSCENTKPQCLAEALQASQIVTTHSAEGLLERFYSQVRLEHTQAKQEGTEFPEIDVLRTWRSVLEDKPTMDQVTAFAVEFESRANPVWPMPFLAETLKKISLRLKMGIISNAQFFTLDLFSAFLDKGLFDLGFQKNLEVYSFREKTAKPGKEIYQVASSRLRSSGFAPENVLYVGNDMLNDILPASSIGFKTALFAGDQRSLRLRKEDPRVNGIHPDIIVNCLSQIPGCV